MENLLANETKALQGIQKLKTAAQSTEHVEKTERMLSLMATPHRWQMSNGEVALVQSPETAKASALLELFNALRDTQLITVDQRLAVLLRLKETVSEYQDALTRDICDLVDREADLLNRGRPAATLERLRQRISNRFLQFIETAKYNPIASQFVGLPKPVPPPGR